MIICRAPYRITLGGGGTDLPAFYRKHEGFLISGAIDKYCMVTAHQRELQTYRIKGYTTEEERKLENIKHNLFREAFKLYHIHPGIECTSLADLPTGTGLGSSGAFLSALLGALQEFNGYEIDQRRVAEDGCKIELDILKEHEGKQDKYASAFGSITAFTFHKNDTVTVRPLANSDQIIPALEHHLCYFYVGQKRKEKASVVLKKQEKKMMEKMLHIKDIGILSLKALEAGNFNRFGELLNDHWEIKKEYSPTSVNPQVNNWYQTAMDKGALGGKIMGAGGIGGYFMFYHPGNKHEIIQFKEDMLHQGLHPVGFNIDREGVKIIHR